MAVRSALIVHQGTGQHLAQVMIVFESLKSSIHHPVLKDEGSLVFRDLGDVVVTHSKLPNLPTNEITLRGQTFRTASRLGGHSKFAVNDYPWIETRKIFQLPRHPSLADKICAPPDVTASGLEAPSF